MKDDRKLFLVRPPAGEPHPSAEAGDADSEVLAPVPSAEEIDASRALADALEQGHEPVFGALVAAYRPEGLSEAAHEAILLRALTASPGPSSAVEPAPAVSEQLAADRLRASLEQVSGSQSQEPLAELAGVLRAAYRPGEIAPLRNEALIAKALGHARARPRPARRMVPVTMAALVGVTALAAGFALLFARMDPQRQMTASAPVSTEGTHAALIRSRSTLELFDPLTPFARTGGQSARIDRIASARAAELRENRFAAWGVR